MTIAVASKKAPPGGEPLPWGSWPDWAITLTVVLSVLILLLILVARIRYGGRQAEESALWLHLVALGILPLFLLAVGNFAVFEHTKEVRFCGSCHVVMKPYIDDLQNPKSTSLTALHFQHRFAPGTECYSCHTTYGVHGTFAAKVEGLRDTVTYVTRTYHQPVKMRTAFPNTLCLQCHAGAKRFMAEEAHLDGDQLSQRLRTGKARCLECHSPAHALPKPQQAARPRGGA